MKPLRSIEFGAGLFLILGVLCAIALVVVSGSGLATSGSDTYKVEARFGNIADLKLRSPVVIAGVRIGEVESIRLDPVQFDARVTLRLDSSAGELPLDTSASIVTSGVLGNRYILLEPGGDIEVLQDGDELFLTQSAVVLEQLISRFMFGGTDEADDASKSEGE